MLVPNKEPNGIKDKSNILYFHLQLNNKLHSTFNIMRSESIIIAQQNMMCVVCTRFNPFCTRVKCMVNEYIFISDMNEKFENCWCFRYEDVTTTTTATTNRNMPFETLGLNKVHGYDAMDRSNNNIELVTAIEPALVFKVHHILYKKITFSH